MLPSRCIFCAATHRQICLSSYILRTKLNFYAMEYMPIIVLGTLVECLRAGMGDVAKLCIPKDMYHFDYAGTS